MTYVPGLDAVRAAVRGDIDDSAGDRLWWCADARVRMSPRHLADRYGATRSQAKSMLQTASARGVLRALPTVNRRKVATPFRAGNRREPPPVNETTPSSVATLRQF
jgi:hypothetical protein